MKTLNKRVDLAARYESEIRAWDWTKIVRECAENLDITEQTELRGSAYLGSILSIYPSGKVWTGWTSNQSPSDEIRDTLFGEILESVAEEYGLSIGSGNGDGCDLIANAYHGDDWLAVDEDGDDTVLFDAWRDEVFRGTEDEARDFLAESSHGFLIRISDHGNVHPASI